MHNAKKYRILSSLFAPFVNVGKTRYFSIEDLCTFARLRQSKVQEGKCLFLFTDCRRRLLPWDEIIARNSRTNAAKSLVFLKKAQVYNWPLMHCATETLPKKSKPGEIVVKNAQNAPLHFFFNVLNVIFSSA